VEVVGPSGQRLTVRLRSGDLDVAAPTLATADWLLFCTHPIREAETERQDPLRPCLTAYAFGNEEELAPDPAYATAEQVHALIAALESDLTARNGSGQPEFQPEELRQFGERAARWVQRSCQYFQESFLEEVRRFVPIPVAVVRIVG
jgi:hypothetical protein